MVYHRRRQYTPLRAEGDTLMVGEGEQLDGVLDIADEEFGVFDLIPISPPYDAPTSRASAPPADSSGTPAATSAAVSALQTAAGGPSSLPEPSRASTSTAAGRPPSLPAPLRASTSAAAGGSSSLPAPPCAPVSVAASGPSSLLFPPDSTPVWTSTVSAADQPPTPSDAIFGTGPSTPPPGAGHAVGYTPDALAEFLFANREHSSAELATLLTSSGSAETVRELQLLFDVGAAVERRVGRALEALQDFTSASPELAAEAPRLLTLLVRALRSRP